MAQHATEQSRFIELRARALTNVLLSGRDDLLVQEQSALGYGIDYLATLRSKKLGVRQFAVELRATYSPVTVDTANAVLKPVLQGMARFGPFPYPTVLFYFTMMESQGWYTWVMEPVDRDDGTMALEMQDVADCRPLDEVALDDIIAHVDRWYDRTFGTKPKNKVARPARIAKNGLKPAASHVVITEIDRMTFDYSEALLQAPEQFNAARECSSHVIKTSSAPLPTVSGWWDWEEDQRGRKVVTLMLTDSATSKTARAAFTPSQIEDRDHVYQRFNELLDDILHPS